MSIRNILVLSTSLVLGACGGGSKPPANPDTSSTPPAGGEEAKSDIPEEGKTADKGEAASKAEEKKEPATAPKIEKPPSESTIGGKSISEVDGAALTAEAKKLGWVKDGVSPNTNTTGSYESIKFDIEKGKQKGYVEIVRPAATPGAPGAGGQPSEVKALREKDGAAVHWDEASDVVVVVFIEGGKTADAKKILASYVKAAKKAAKTAEKTEKAGETGATPAKGEKSAATSEKKPPTPAPSK
jgi:hypothetical protein